MKCIFNANRVTQNKSERTTILSHNHLQICVVPDGYPSTTSLPSPTTSVTRTTFTEAQVSDTYSSIDSTDGHPSTSIASTHRYTSTSVVSTDRGTQSSPPTDHYPTSTSSPSTAPTTSSDSQPTSHYQNTKAQTTGRSPRPAGPRPQSTPRAKGQW